MSDEDREVAGRERRRARRGARPRPGATYRLRLVAHEPRGVRPVLQRRRQPDALVPAALPVGSRPPARLTSNGGLERAWRRGLRAGQRGFAEAVIEELARRARGARLLQRLPPLSRAAVGARRELPDAALLTSSTSPGPQSDYWHVLPARSASPSTTVCWRTTSSAFTRRAGSGTSSSRPSRWSGDERERRTERRSPTRAANRV